MNIASLLSFIACVIYLYFSYYVIRLDRRSLINNTFSYLCLACAAWSFCVMFYYPAPSAAEAAFWQHAGALGYATVPCLAFLFCLSLTETRLIKSTWFWIISFLPAIAFIVYALLGNPFPAISYVKNSFGWTGIPNTESIWYWTYITYYFSLVVAGVVYLQIWAARQNISRKKRQARIVGQAAITALGLSFINETVLPAFGFYLPQIPAVISLIWIFGNWYAITKYQLMITTAIASEQILARIQDMTFLLDNAGNICMMNQQAENTLMYQKAEMTGKPLALYLREPIQFTELLGQIQKQDTPMQSFELNYITAFKGGIPTDSSGWAIFDPAGELLGYSIISQDVRETKQLQKEIWARQQTQRALEETNMRLMELDKKKTDFLSTVSHELRTPLTSILGFSKIVSRSLGSKVIPALENAEPSAQRISKNALNSVEIIIEESERLTLIINDVLDISRMDAGKIDWRNETVNMEEVILGAVSATDNLFRNSPVLLIKKLQTPLPAIQGDQSRLRQVIVNLLSNAAKFTDSGSVECTAFSENDQIVIQITDTGHGIDAHNQQFIFDKFKQFGDTLTNKPKGSGLGLPICKHIVEHHGGSIHMVSEPGQGTQFTVRLPVTGQSNSVIQETA